MFYSSKDNTRPDLPLHLSARLVSVYDDPTRTYTYEVVERERKHNRTPVCILTPDSTHTGKFLSSLSREYGKDLDWGLTNVLKCGFEFGQQHSFGVDDYVETTEVKEKAFSIPFIRRLVRDVGHDARSIVNETLTNGCYFGNNPENDYPSAE